MGNPTLSLKMPLPCSENCSRNILGAFLGCPCVPVFKCLSNTALEACAKASNLPSVEHFLGKWGRAISHGTSDGSVILPLTLLHTFGCNHSFPRCEPTQTERDPGGHKNEALAKRPGPNTFSGMDRMSFRSKAVGERQPKKGRREGGEGRRRRRPCYTSVIVIAKDGSFKRGRGRERIMRGVF